MTRLIRVLLALVLAGTTQLIAGYSSVVFRPFMRRTSTLEMKRGRGSFKREIGKSKHTGGLSSSDDEGISRWCVLPPGNKLPKTENQVAFLDTELPTLKNSGTNPTGAVSVLTYNGQVYCFQSSCPSCKIPLKKSKAVPPEGNEKAPRLVCDFCKSTYSLGNGARLGTDKANAGLFGGVVSSLLSTNTDSSGPLTVYKLGEKNGKLLIDPTGENRPL